MIAIEDLIEAYPPPQEHSAILDHKPNRYRSSRRDIADSIEKMREENHWHDNMVGVVGALVRQGNDDATILALGKDWRLNGYTEEETLKEIQTAIEGARKKGFGPEQDALSVPEGEWPTTYSAFDVNHLPRRQWIYDRHYIRGYVSVLASAGGIGKTSLQVAEALSIACGRSLLGEEVHEQTNVWLINLEDPVEEMQRRIIAAMQSHCVRREEVEGRLFVDAGRRFRLLFATQSHKGLEPNDELAAAMIEKIKRHNIGVVFIDPFVGSHAVNENDNMAINAVVDVVRRVADETNCAIGLVHHVRKSNGNEADVDSIRGAGSLIGAARAARIANKMSKEEAQKLGIPEKTSWSAFKVSNGKANLSPPAEKSTWRELKSVSLANGDTVGVVHAYVPPIIKAATDIELGKAKLALKAADEPLRSAESAAGWAGFLVALALELDIGPSKKADRSHEQEIERIKVRKLLKDLVDRGDLNETSQFIKRDGRDVPIYVVCDEFGCKISSQSGK